MAIPTYDVFIPTLLRVLAAHPNGLRSRDAYEKVADAVKLSDAERAELLPSGGQPVYQNRIGWAHDRLNIAKTSKVADAGEATKKPESAARSLEPQSPEERIDDAIEELNESLSQDLLAMIADASPAFFERLVLDLLLAMGYGASRADLQQVGGSGDAGIDGVIALDRLGLEKVYVQAKRWKASVGRPEIQGFFGALAGRRARKGVFITTSGFTREAKDYALSVSDSIVLVDGKMLATLMIDHGVGVSHKALKIGRLDGDYFEDA